MVDRSFEHILSKITITFFFAFAFERSTKDSVNFEKNGRAGRGYKAKQKIDQLTMKTAMMFPASATDVFRVSQRDDFQFHGNYTKK